MEILLAESGALDAAVRAQLRPLWDAAFDDMTDEDEEHAYGGVHVVALDAGAVVGHASVVPRRILVGERPFDTGYVEAVAVAPSRQGAGVGTTLMRALEPELRRRWTLGALGTGSHGFYERLGWERWRGPSYVLTPTGRMRSAEEDDGIMVLRFGPSAAIDLTAPITCEDRPGDAW